jgi:hypothetical protein
MEAGGKTQHSSITDNTKQAGKMKRICGRTLLYKNKESMKKA